MPGWARIVVMIVLFFIFVLVAWSLLATGARAVFPRAALRAEFGARAIGLEVMELGAACRTFNVLVSEGRRAVLAVLFD